MKANNKLLTSVDDVMDKLYGSVGTPEREQFRREAYAYYTGRLIQDVRKAEKMAQKELAIRIGAKKSYISKIENSIIEPGVSTFYRIVSALGRSV